MIGERLFDGGHVFFERGVADGPPVPEPDHRLDPRAGLVGGHAAWFEVGGGGDAALPGDREAVRPRIESFDDQIKVGAGPIYIAGVCFEVRGEAVDVVAVGHPRDRAHRSNSPTDIIGSSATSSTLRIS